ncbi:MAG TPA: hypothetical protein VHZ55_08450 [Bryobacteraceae bacterium]|nr:hypothetical protein [Bryobacteraceae bacterium]
MRPLKITSALLVLAFASFASHHRSNPHNGQAGVFDYYLFVLSWSPEFCHSKPNAAECNKQTGFVVHGLWPQNTSGSYPSNCATNQPAPSNSASLTGIMPIELIPHEWQQHGTCSGLSGDAYLALIRKLYTSLTIPDRLKGPTSSFTWRPQDLKHAFEGANPQLKDPDIAVQLRGNYLNAVEICVSKGADPQPIACSNIKDAPGGTFVVPPVR